MRDNSVELMDPLGPPPPGWEAWVTPHVMEMVAAPEIEPPDRAVVWAHRHRTVVLAACLLALGALLIAAITLPLVVASGLSAALALLSLGFRSWLRSEALDSRTDRGK